MKTEILLDNRYTEPVNLKYDTETGCIYICDETGIRTLYNLFILEDGRLMFDSYKLFYYNPDKIYLKYEGIKKLAIDDDADFGGIILSEIGINISNDGLLLTDKISDEEDVIAQFCCYDYIKNIKVLRTSVFEWRFINDNVNAGKYIKENPLFIIDKVYQKPMPIEYYKIAETIKPEYVIVKNECMKDRIIKGNIKGLVKDGYKVVQEIGFGNINGELKDKAMSDRNIEEIIKQ